MAGYSDSAFRRICRGLGATATVTEMVSVQGLTRRSLGSSRLLLSHPSEHPLGIQLYGAIPKEFSRATALVRDMGFEFIDINAGCPVKKVLKSGSGASLLKDLPRLLDIVQAVAESSSGLPVTVKIRIGWSPEEALDEGIGTLLGDRGACALFVHARYRSEPFAGRPDTATLSRIVTASPIPVIANGESSSPEAALEFLSRSGASGLLVGRGAIGKPWIFRALRGGGPGSPLPGELSGTVLSHLGMMREYLPEPFVYHVFRGQLVHYLKGFRGASGLRGQAVAIESVEDVERICGLAEGCRDEQGG